VAIRSQLRQYAGHYAAITRAGATPMNPVSKSMILAVFTAVTVAGCASPAPPPGGKIDENSAGYVSGFTDGCATANPRYRKENNLTAKRDPQYDTDADYHTGWDKGYLKCEDKVDSGGLPIPGNSVIM
jgi:hypothetical protein